MKNKYISWRRVGTFKQNRSGLGLAAQKEIIRYFIERDGGEWVATTMSVQIDGVNITARV